VKVDKTKETFNSPILVAGNGGGGGGDGGG